MIHEYLNKIHMQCVWEKYDKLYFLFLLFCWNNYMQSLFFKNSFFKCTADSIISLNNW